MGWVGGDGAPARRALTARPTLHFRPDKPPLGSPLRIGDGASWRRLATDAYALHYLESPSGVKLALTTDPGAGDLREVLAGLHAALGDVLARHPGAARAFPADAFGARVAAYLKGAGLL